MSDILTRKVAAIENELKVMENVTELPSLRSLFSSVDCLAQLCQLFYINSIPQAKFRAIKTCRDSIPYRSHGTGTFVMHPTAAAAVPLCRVSCRLSLKLEKIIGVEIDPRFTIWQDARKYVNKYPRIG